MVAWPGKHFFGNLFARRTLLAEMVRRDFTRRFVGSSVGWLWMLVHPLVLLASWTFVFHYCLGQRVPPGQKTGNYTLFLFCGQLPWLLFQDTVARSSTCLVDNSNLITKTLFPSEMIPISIFLSSLVNHLMTLVLALAAVAIWGEGLSAWPALLPAYMLLLGLFSIGLSWIVSSLQVFLRDTSQFTLVALTLWFWVTPIFISIEQVPQRFRILLKLNPLSAAVTSYRELLLDGKAPALDQFAWFTFAALGTFMLGGLLFRQLKRGFADVL
jgi:ABC-type polysaccharide/polyol phosphate export permease